MKLTFNVGNSTFEYRRNCFTGRTVLFMDGDQVMLHSPLDLSTHFTGHLNTIWELTIPGHVVRIEKQRPLLLAGCRPHTYRVYVDDALILERKGF